MSGGGRVPPGSSDWYQKAGWRGIPAVTGAPPYPADMSRKALSDLRHPGLDAIRFASYRTAAKLRYVQKRTNMHLIDIWNIIEAFRENGLNTLDSHMSVKVSRLETLISTLYHNLNKRLPTEQHINIQSSTSTLLNWMLAAYDREFLGQLNVFSVKTALGTLCNSKPLDKLRYIFTQISDSNGHLSQKRFSDYLLEVLCLPAAVFESPSFHYKPDLIKQIFDGLTKINVNDFMDVMLAEPGPECISWLPLLYRLAASETVVHQTICDGCRRDSFTGLRYKCDICYNYNLCQDCFWLGRISSPHSLEHQVKEYMAFNPSRPLSTSVKLLRCVPENPNASRPRFPETPERTLDMSHIIPACQQIMLNGVDEESNPVIGTCDTWSTGRSLSLGGLPDWGQLEDEHKLIAHYAATLASQTTSPGCESSDSSRSFDQNKAKRSIVYALENKNREISYQINKIKEQQDKCDGAMRNPNLVAELKSLRSHRTQLESHMITLQDSRKSLLGQLEGLMKLLKPNNSKPATNATSPPQSVKMGSHTGSGHRSAPPTPTHNHYASNESLRVSEILATGLSSLQSTYSGSMGSMRSQTDLAVQSEGNNVQNDLLFTADSVTNAMSSLVRDLNEENPGEDYNINRSLPRKDRVSSYSGNKSGIRSQSSSLQRSRRSSSGSLHGEMPNLRDSWSKPPPGLLN